MVTLLISRLSKLLKMQLSGKLVSGTNNIDITTAQKGLILLRVQGDQGTTTWKLIKQ